MKTKISWNKKYVVGTIVSIILCIIVVFGLRYLFNTPQILEGDLLYVVVIAYYLGGIIEGGIKKYFN